MKEKKSVSELIAFGRVFQSLAPFTEKDDSIIEDIFLLVEGHQGMAALKPRRAFIFHVMEMSFGT